MSEYPGYPNTPGKNLFIPYVGNFPDGIYKPCTIVKDWIQGAIERGDAKAATALLDAFPGDGKMYIRDMVVGRTKEDCARCK